jgi:hypothetical protein
VSVTRSVVPKLSVREIEVPVHAIAQFEPLIGSDRYGELRRAAALASNVDGCMLAHSRSISTPMVRQPGMEWIRPTPAKGSRTRSHPTREASIAWRIGYVQALIPGVLALAQRFDISEGPWSDLDAFFSDAISCLWERITTWSGTGHAYAASDLISGARTRLRTLQTTERRHRSRRVDTPVSLDLVPARGDRSGEELLATALADATGQGLAVADAAVLYATNVLGLSLAELRPGRGAHPSSPAPTPLRHRPAGGVSGRRQKPFVVET